MVLRSEIHTAIQPIVETNPQNQTYIT